MVPQHSRFSAKIHEPSGDISDTQSLTIMDNCNHGDIVMPGAIVSKLTPEQEELDRKRAELSGVRAALAERELELADLRAELKSFEGRYLRQVGVLYAELDDWEAKVVELEASLRPSASAKQNAQEARKRAEETHQATHGEASKVQEFKPSADLKSLFRDVAKRIHPDFAKDDADRQRRTLLMAQANDAYSRGDAETLQRILDDYDEGVGAELIRVIRQIHQAKKNIAAIEQELIRLRASEIAQLMQDADNAQQEGRDLLRELAASVRERISDAMKMHENLAVELSKHGR
jgi:predicted  nucleic acid-binding Zn-ribbon protein